jgi:hemoglobin/transferrin/lactoferrin receptor protein
VKKTIIVCFFCIGAFMSFAQKITIRDNVSRQPIEMVTLYSETPSATGLTDAKGHADISAFKGAESIIIRIIGYETAELSYSEIEKANFTVFLKQSNISLDEVVISASR